MFFIRFFYDNLNYLAKLSDWGIANKLVINPLDRLNLLFIVPRRNFLLLHLSISLYLHNTLVAISPTATFLGVTLNKSKKFPTHVSNVTRKVAYGFSVLFQNKEAI